MPVSRVEDIKFNIGKITLTLLRLYRDEVKKYVKRSKKAERRSKK
jgi:hypothetical protein